MWTDTTFSVGEHRVTLSLELLEPAERDTIAVSVAWLAVASADQGSAVNSATWHTLIEDVIGPHIALTIIDDQLESLDAAWWGETVRQALAAFIRANDLEILIERCLSSMPSQVPRRAAVS